MEWPRSLDFESVLFYSKTSKKITENLRAELKVVEEQRTQVKSAFCQQLQDRNDSHRRWRDRWMLLEEAPLAVTSEYAVRRAERANQRIRDAMKEWDALLGE